MPEEEIEDFVDDPVMSIGTLSKKLGLSVSALRKYETGGLLIPHRTDSGHRLFSQEDANRVRNIQHLIQNLGLNLEGIRRLQALLPCWSFLPCTKKIRNECDAYKDSTKPCWMIKGVGCAPQGNECRGCVVYRFGSLCTEDIKRVLHDQITLNDSCKAVRELLERKLR
ncbi:MAG: MerR family transcriptional regulator [Planctomycetota bacterium]|jgi:MerR family transcriptional regulator/heat shock protein HspR